MARRLSIPKQPIFSTLNNHLIDYPTLSNISYWWGFGLLAGPCLIIQILTGVFLAMHYTPHVDPIFSSMEHIMRDVKGSWLLHTCMLMERVCFLLWFISILFLVYIMEVM